MEIDMEEEEFIVPDLPTEELEIQPEDGIEVLKKQLEEAKREAAEAKKAAQLEAQRAFEKSQEASDATHRAMENDLALIEGAIAEIERNDSGLQYALAQANAAGDHQRVAAIQTEMMDNRTKMQQLTAGRDAISERLQAPRVQPVAPVIDPVENVASQIPPRSAEWVRAHPEFVRDPVKWQRLQGADMLARGEGLKVDTDEYFARIEEILNVSGGRQVQQRGAVEEDHAENPMSAAAKPTRGRESPPVAPVTTGGGRSAGVTLTKAEKQAADDIGMDYLEYAKHRDALLKQGRITRH